MNLKYLRMVRSMREKASARAKKSGGRRLKKAKKKAKQEPWFLYILECRDGSFYTGITNNLDRRLKMHRDGKAAKYTRSRRPVRLLYQEKCAGRVEALVRECAVKALPKKKKKELVAGK